MTENTHSNSLENEQRMDALELNLMDLENTVQELNEVILRQYRDIDRLTRVQQELLNRMPSGTNADAGPSALDELPPPLLACVTSVEFPVARVVGFFAAA